MLIGLNTTEESMKELALLTDTAGAEVVFSEVQKRPRDKGTYVGSGKARELALAASALDADVAIFNAQYLRYDALSGYGRYLSCRRYLRP